MSSLPDELITDEDRDNLTEAAYKMQNTYRKYKTWYDAVAEVAAECPKVKKWQLEGMWKAIDAYVDINL